MNAKEFKELRKTLKLTQQEIAVELGIDRRTVINYEKGETIPESKVKLIHLLFNKSEVNYNKQIKPNKEVDTVDSIELNEDSGETIENTFGNRFEKLPNGEYLMYMPLFEWDVAASLLDNEGDTRHPDYAELQEHITIVKRPLQGKYSAFRIKGESMEGNEINRNIPDGSIVWGRELQPIHWKDQLRINKFPLWIIGSTDFGRPTLKEIVSHDVKTGAILVDSWNPSVEYAHNVKISLNTVKMLYYVMKVEMSFSDIY